MRKSNSINSSAPAALSSSTTTSSFAFPPFVEREEEVRNFANSFLIERKPGGTEANKTAVRSTIPMSSSSERCVSVAASSSSVAMLNETENAKSLPSAPIVPAVSLMTTDVISNAAIQRLNRYSCSISCPLAIFDPSSRLIIRQLAVKVSERQSRQSKPKQVRYNPINHNKKEFHKLSGVLIGTHFARFAQYAQCKGRFKFCEVVAHCLKCIQSIEIQSISGSDAKHLELGLCTASVLPSQLRNMLEAKHNSRHSTRKGVENKVLSASLCLMIILSMACQIATFSDAVQLSVLSWFENATKIISNWNTTELVDEAREAVAAEARCLERGLLGMKVAQKETKRLRISSREATARLNVVYLRNAMFPPRWKIEEGTHQSICEFIQSDKFIATCALLPKSNAVYFDARPELSLSSLCGFQRFEASETDSSVASSASTLSTCSSSEDCDHRFDSSEIWNRLMAYINV